MKKKISSGWFLIIFQIIEYICCILTNNPIKFENIPYFIGANLFGIIGLVMVILDIAKKMDKKDEMQKKMQEKQEIDSIAEFEEEKPKIKSEKNLQINDTSSIMTQDDILKDNIHQSNEKKVENENNTFLKTLSIILGIFLLISIIVIFSLLIKNEKQRLKIIDFNEEYSDYDELMEYKSLYFDEMAKNVKLSDKVSFMDEHIVFVLDGYGNYYYNYDCMQEVTKGKKFKFLSYNTENAISLGYKKFNCN